MLAMGVDDFGGTVRWYACQPHRRYRPVAYRRGGRRGRLGVRRIEAVTGSAPGACRRPSSAWRRCAMWSRAAATTWWIKVALRLENRGSWRRKSPGSSKNWRRPPGGSHRGGGRWAGVSKCSAATVDGRMRIAARHWTSARTNSAAPLSCGGHYRRQGGPGGRCHRRPHRPGKAGDLMRQAAERLGGKGGGARHGPGGGTDIAALPAVLKSVPDWVAAALEISQ